MIGWWWTYNLKIRPVATQHLCVLHFLEVQFENHYFAWSQYGRCRHHCRQKKQPVGSREKLYKKHCQQPWGRTITYMFILCAELIDPIFIHRFINIFINNDYWKGSTFLSPLNQGSHNVTIWVEECTRENHKARSGKRATGGKRCESCRDIFLCYPHSQRVRLYW